LNIFILQESVDDALSDKSQNVAPFENISQQMLSPHSLINDFVPVNTPRTSSVSPKSEPAHSDTNHDQASLKSVPLTSDLASQDGHMTESSVSLVDNEEVIEGVPFVALNEEEGGDIDEKDEPVLETEHTTDFEISKFIRKVDISLNKKVVFDNEINETNYINVSKEDESPKGDLEQKIQNMSEKTKKEPSVVLEGFNHYSQDLTSMAITGLQVKRESVFLDPGLYARHYRNAASTRAKTFNQQKRPRSTQLVIYKKKISHNNERKTPSKFDRNQRFAQPKNSNLNSKKLPIMPRNEFVRWDSKLTTNTEEGDSLGEMISRKKVKYSKQIVIDMLLKRDFTEE